MIRYYLLGIFVRAPHPFRQTVVKKHNPLQRLAYLFLWVVISPMIWASGWAYIFYAEWDELGVDRFFELETVAFVHAIGAFSMLVFLIAHIYLITTGPTLMAHMKAMITGWECDVPDSGENTESATKVSEVKVFEAKVPESKVPESEVAQTNMTETKVTIAKES
jgi:hypothetical protein